MIRSASANVSATIGSIARRSLQHVDVLRALAGVEERDLGRRAAAEEDAPGRAASSTSPGCRPRSAFERLRRPCRRARGVAVVDGDAHRGAGQAPGRAAPAAACRPPAALAATRCSWADHVGVVVPPRTSAPRSGALAHARRAARPPPADAAVAAPDRGRRTTCARLAAVATAGRRTPRARRGSWCRRSRTRSRRPRRTPPGGGGHSRSSVFTAERRVRPSRYWGWARRSSGSAAAPCRAAAMTILNSPAAPAAALRWPMFDLTEPSAIDPGWHAERRRSTSLQALPARRRRRRGSRCRAPRSQATVAGSTPALLPGALDGQPLADRVRRGDALALAVAGAADAAQHGVDPVAVALGVGEPLEHEQRSALAHHEAVRAGVERPGAGRGERADLAELHEARRRPCCGRRRR